MSDFIVKMGFVEHGKYYPKEFNIKGKANAKSLLGYVKYTARQDSRNRVDDQLNYENGYLGYTARESSRSTDYIRTYTNGGWISNDNQREDFKSEVAKYFSEDGDLVWMPISSFKDYFTAEKYGLMNEEDYAVVFEKTLNKFFKKANLDPNNMIWWMDYHSNKNHPHTHLVFLEKEKTKVRGKFEQSELNYFKGTLINEANKRLRLINGSTNNLGLFKNKDIKSKELKNNIAIKLKSKFDRDINKKIAALYLRLPEVGRLQYNSFHMKDHKKEIDEIVELILNHPEVKNEYQDYKNMLSKFDKDAKDATNADYRNFEELEDKKIKVQIANNILKMKKDLNKINVQGLEEYGIDDINKIVNNHFNDFKEISIKDIKLTGSRVNYCAEEYSDIDVVDEYDGKLNEYEVSNELNTKPLDINGIKVDIKPIRKEESGNMKTWINNSVLYHNKMIDEKILLDKTHSNLMALAKHYIQINDKRSAISILKNIKDDKNVYCTLRFLNINNGNKSREYLKKASALGDSYSKFMLKQNATHSEKSVSSALESLSSASQSLRAKQSVKEFYDQEERENTYYESFD